MIPGLIVLIRDPRRSPSGDVHYTPDGQEHWHGAAHGHLMSHISITQGPATWGEHVADEEYPSNE